MTTKQYQDENGTIVYSGRRSNESESVATVRHTYVERTYATRLETPDAPFYHETWFWEQVVYVLLCLVPASLASYVQLATKGPVGVRDGAFMALAALLQLKL